jgi:transcriptional regulator with XRE-family HTH domain
MDGNSEARRLGPAFAEEVRVLLARKRISAVQLAKLMGVSQPYLSRRLNGAVAFDLDDIERIGQVLDVDPLSILPKGVGAGGDGGTNDRLTPKPARPTPSRRTDEPRRARLVFDSPDRQPQGPSSHVRRGSTRPVSAIPASTRRPAGGRPANRTKAA